MLSAFIVILLVAGTFADRDDSNFGPRGGQIGGNQQPIPRRFIPNRQSRCADDCKITDWGNIAFEDFIHPRERTRLQPFSTNLVRPSPIFTELVDNKLNFELSLGFASCVAPHQVSVAIHKAIDPRSNRAARCSGSSGGRGNGPFGGFGGRNFIPGVGFDPACYPIRACEPEPLASTDARFTHSVATAFPLEWSKIDNRNWFGKNVARFKGLIQYTHSHSQSQNDNGFLSNFWNFQPNNGNGDLSLCVRIEVKNCDGFLVLTTEKRIVVEIHQENYKIFEFYGAIHIPGINWPENPIGDIVWHDDHDFYLQIFNCHRNQQNLWIRNDDVLINHNGFFSLCIWGEHWSAEQYEILTMWYRIPSTCQICREPNRGFCLEDPIRRSEVGSKLLLFTKSAKWESSSSAFGATRLDFGQAFTSIQPEIGEVCAPNSFQRNCGQGYFFHVRLHEKYFLDCELEFGAKAQLLSSSSGGATIRTTG